VKANEVTEVIRVLAVHVGAALDDAGPYCRALESADRQDVATVAEAWMASHTPGAALPRPGELRALCQQDEAARWRAKAAQPAPASMAGVAGAASSRIGADTAELVRRKCLPASDPAHLTAAQFAEAMAQLGTRYPAAQWGVAAAAYETQVTRDAEIRGGRRAA
jgi:hypothetical protein